VPDREKVIKAAEICLRYIDDGDCPTECPYFDLCTKYEKRVVFQPLIRDALALLKEQEAVVRCKDCKHRPKEIPFTTSWGRHDTYLEFPEGSRCPGQCSDDSYYSWKPDDDWFCADGEKRTD